MISAAISKRPGRTAILAEPNPQTPPGKEKNMDEMIDSTKADNGATPFRTRRWFLASAPVAAAALAVTGAAKASAPTASTEEHRHPSGFASISDKPSAMDRYLTHLEGLKQAVQEIDPTCNVWVHPQAPEDTVIRFWLTGSRKVGA